jgi:hypothetical protein
VPGFRNVEVYPISGWWGTAWVEDDPDGDAFAKVSRGICDAYSSALANARHVHTVSLLRIFIDTEGRVVPGAPDARQTVVLSPSHADRVFEGFEQAAVRVGAGFAALDHDEQRRIVLDAVHAAARGMAQFRGLDLAAFEQARAAVVEADYTFTWTSDWKASPGRRWRARCSFRTSADGFGRLALHVATPDGSVSATSSEQVAWTTVEGFARAAKTLRWVGPDRVEVVPCIDWLGHRTGTFAVGIELLPTGLQLAELALPGIPGGPLASDQSAVTSPSPSAGLPVPPVSLIVPDTNAREIHTVGGGPTNYVPDLYWRTLHSLFDQLRSSEWHEWWAPADLAKLEVWWRAAEDGPERLFVRRSKNKVIARIERTSEGLRDADPVQAARDDLAGLMTAVQHRMGLGTPPVLQ